MKVQLIELTPYRKTVVRHKSPTNEKTNLKKQMNISSFPLVLKRLNYLNAFPRLHEEIRGRLGSYK